MTATPLGDSWWYQRHWGTFRTGTARAKIAWEGGDAQVLLYEQGVPRTVSGFLGVLPLEIPVVHVAWSGEMVMGLERYSFGPSEPENEVRLVQPGDLTWDPKFGEICFTYGTAECKLPSGPNCVVVFGGIDGGLQSFASFCRQRRMEGVGVLRVEAEQEQE